MTISAIDNIAPAVDVKVTDDTLSVDLEDGRTIAVPLEWYPRLVHGTPRERANWKISHFGIHWPDLDEDISIRGLLSGNRSGESSGSLKFWLRQRSLGRKSTLEDWSKEKRKRASRTKKK